jgi:hypothetical protein
MQLSTPCTTEVPSLCDSLTSKTAVGITRNSACIWYQFVLLYTVQT